MQLTHRLSGAILALALATHPVPAAAQESGDPIPGYPEGVHEIEYRSDGDDSMQPALFWAPEKNEPVPLLVALHTWSSDYRQAGGEAQYAKWCRQAGWAFVHPNFRGVNKSPEALGSDLVVADIRSAVKYVQSNANIDARRIYCVGVSGGGHASLLMAAREPDLWAGVSAWCGIADIAAWHAQCKGSSFSRYADMIESALGGSPESSDEFRNDAWHRSPLAWIEKSDRLPPLDINHGVNDGRAGSVPFTQSIRAFNAAVPPSARLSESAIEAYYQSQSVPPQWSAINIAAADELYGDHVPLFRRTVGTTRLTIFDGGHEIVHEAALNWLASQAKNRPVNWIPSRSIPFSVISDDRQSGK